MGEKQLAAGSDVTSRDLVWLLLSACLAVVAVSLHAMRFELHDWWRAAALSLGLLGLIWASALRHPSLGYRIRLLAFTLAVIAPLPFSATSFEIRGKSEMALMLWGLTVLAFGAIPINWRAASGNGSCGASRS